MLHLLITGTWRFQLTHGQIRAGQFQRSNSAITGIIALSREVKHPPHDAFDDAADTRWCARGGDFPPWLEADLGETRHVTGAKLTWENTDDRYACRVEGRVVVTNFIQRRSRPHSA